MTTLTLVPIGGLSNRFFAIASAIGFCRDNNWRLKIFWFKDWGMGADFHHILELSSSVENVDIVDAGWMDYRYDRPRRRNLWLPAIWQYFAFDKRFYEKDLWHVKYESYGEIFRPYNSVYMNHGSLFYEWLDMFRVLSPVKSLREAICCETRLFDQQRMIGVHIRRTDMNSETISPLPLFIHKMEQELEINRQTKFYVASDSFEEKQKLIAYFGDAVITSLQEARRDTIDGIKDAMVELYTLSATEKIYGTVRSTYSLLAAKLSDISIEVLSI